MYWIDLVLIIAVAWWFVNFEPLQLLIDYIFKQFRVTHLSDYLHASLGCWKCWSFWLTLFYLDSFQLACLAALIAYTITLCLTILNNKQ